MARRPHDAWPAPLQASPPLSCGAIAKRGRHRLEKTVVVPPNQRDGIEGGTPRPTRVGGGICTLLEEAARRRLDALPLAAVVAQTAAMEAGELLALTRPSARGWPQAGSPQRPRWWSALCR